MPGVLLKCFLMEESPDDDTFTIHVDNTFNISELRRYIRNVKWVDSSGVYLSDLKLWKVDICPADDEKMNILRRGNCLHTSQMDNKLDGEELDIEMPISFYFQQTGPKEPNKNHINLIIRGPMDLEG